MSDPTKRSPGSPQIDRRAFIAGGVATAAAAVIGPVAVAHAAEDDHVTSLICATVDEHVSPRSFNARAIPTGHQFRVKLAPGARVRNGAGTAHKLKDFRQGQSVGVVPPPGTPEVNAATVGDDGPVQATAVVELMVGSISDIINRADD
jgi:hypothetical protein